MNYEVKYEIIKSDFSKIRELFWLNKIKDLLVVIALII